MSLQPNTESPITIQSLTPHGSIHETESYPHEKIQPPCFHAQYALPDIPQHRPNAFMAYWNKIGGGSFMVSLLIHAGILITAYFIVETIVQDPPIDLSIGSGNKNGEARTHELKAQTQKNKRDALNAKIPLQKIKSYGESDIPLPETPDIDFDRIVESSMSPSGSMSAAGLGNDGVSVGFGSGQNIGIGGQPGINPLPPSLLGRCGHVERVAKMRANGGNDQCEKAVSTALAWFKEHQNPDGSWGTGNKGAMTGFALLCYLGRCETPDSEFYGDTVMKGILYLVELQKKNPNRMFSEVTTGNAPAYEHGIATYALGELYTLARMGKRTLPGMREAFEEGVKVIVENQQAKGSWVYNTDTGTYEKNGRDDLSVTGWQYQALKAAKLTELKINGLAEAIDKAVKYLESKQTADGGFGSTNREAHYNQWDLTGAGVLGLQTLAHGKSSEIKKGVKFSHALFQKEPPKWGEQTKLYNWYYYAQMFFQNGGPEWKHWNETALPEILKSQNKDGSWIHKSASQGGNNVYSTALCTLMLEVYYRYLKVGDKEQESIFGKR